MKINTGKQSWTTFWKSLGIEIGREKYLSAQAVKDRDFRKLLVLGVSNSDISTVWKKFEVFKDGHIQFHKLTIFFSKDPDTIKKWTDSLERTNAFLKLGNKISSGSRFSSKNSLMLLVLLINIFKRKQEIPQYSAKDESRGYMRSMKLRDLVSVLRYGERYAQFHGEGVVNYGKFKVAIIKKTNGVAKIYKYILIRKIRKNLTIYLALDTPEERRKIRRFLSKKFKSPVQESQREGDLSKFFSFLKKGESEHFILTGAEMNSEEVKMSIYPRFARPINIVKADAYKENTKKLKEENMFEIFPSVRILHKSVLLSKQVRIRLINYKSDDIVGGIRLILSAQGLDLESRDALKADFLTDFDLELDIPIEYDVDEEEVYKKFLYNPTKKKKRIEVISDKAREISRTLAKYGLVPLPKPTEESAKQCIDRHCNRKFIPVWTSDTNCSCGSPLQENALIVVKQIISEQKIRDFFKTVCKNKGYKTFSDTKSLATRKIYVLEVRGLSKNIILIPITTRIGDKQLELLKYRYPNGIFVTSEENSSYISSKGLMVVELYKLAYRLCTDPITEIERLLDDMSKISGPNIDSLAHESASRILNDNWYLDQKSLSAEFFEADCYSILNYIFKNSVWLGARKKGQKVADSASAFPLEDTLRGCFITDAKFTTKTYPSLGSVIKNKHYVISGQKDNLIKKNGGLRGFTFISNKPAPSVFQALMEHVIGRKYIRGGYLRANQLLAIYEIFKINVTKIEANGKVKTAFYNLAEAVFLKKKNGAFSDRVIVWSDEELNKLIEEFREEIKKITPPLLSVKRK